MLYPFEPSFASALYPTATSYEAVDVVMLSALTPSTVLDAPLDLPSPTVSPLINASVTVVITPKELTLNFETPPTSAFIRSPLNDEVALSANCVPVAEPPKLPVPPPNTPLPTIISPVEAVPTKVVCIVNGAVELAIDPRLITPFGSRYNATSPVVPPPIPTLSFAIITVLLTPATPGCIPIITFPLPVVILPPGCALPLALFPLITRLPDPVVVLFPLIFIPAPSPLLFPGPITTLPPERVDNAAPAFCPIKMLYEALVI